MYKRLLKSGRFDNNLFNEAVLDLSNGRKLRQKFRDHELMGNLSGHRECHIMSDVFLIYQIDYSLKEIIIVNFSNLFYIFSQS